MHAIKLNAKSTTIVPFIMFIASLLISSSNGIIANGVDLSSSQIVFFRMGIGVAILSMAFIATRRKLSVLNNVRNLVILLASGISMAIELLFLYEAYQSAGVAMATILLYMSSVAVMALSPVLFRERLSTVKCLSFAIVVVGSLLVNAVAFESGASVWGILCGLGSALGFAGIVILNKKIADTPGLERALIQMLTCAIVCTVYVAATEGLPQSVAAVSAMGAWSSIVVIGVLGGAGSLMYFMAISKLPIQSVAICGYLEPVCAVLMSVTILGESMLPLQIAGTALIIGGALFGELERNRAPKALPLSHVLACRSRAVSVRLLRR